MDARVALNPFEIFKTADEARVAYGWASVISENGTPIVDDQDDVIEPHELLKATTEFMKDARMAMAMHERNAAREIDPEMQKGIVVHSFPMIADIMKSLGIESKREGWIVGVYVADDTTWEMVKSGKLAAFSIGARAHRKEIV